jgi:hypothetical protein
VGIRVVQTIELFKSNQHRVWLEVLLQEVPAISFIACSFVKLVFDHARPVVGFHYFFASGHVAVDLPVRDLFRKSLFHLLLLHALSLHFSSLFVCHGDLLDLGCLFYFDTLVLHGGTFVLELGNREPRVALNVVLLIDITKAKLNQVLAELSILKSSFNSGWSENTVNHHAILAFFVIFLTLFSHTQRKAPPDFPSAVLLLLFLWDELLLEWLNKLMLADVDENLANRRRLGLHDETFLGLDRRTTLFIDDRLTVFVETVHHARQFGRHFAILNLLGESHNLLMGILLKPRWLLAHARHTS